MAQTINLKHTSDLVSDFRHQLLTRRDYLYDLQSTLPEDIEEALMKCIDDEISKIEKIVKLIKTNKIF